MIKKESDTPFFYMSIEDNLLICTMKEGCIITNEVSESMISERLRLSCGNTYPAILDGRNVKYWTMNSRNHSMKSNAFDLMECAAIVFKSKVMKVLWNFTIPLANFPIPYRVFSDMESAKIWIKSKSEIMAKT